MFHKAYETSALERLKQKYILDWVCGVVVEVDRQERLFFVLSGQATLVAQAVQYPAIYRPDLPPRGINIPQLQPGTPDIQQ